MANCSDAHGTYEFLFPDANDNTVKALALFITLMQKRLGDCEYNTYLTDCDDDYDNNLEYVTQNLKPASNKGSKDSFSLITPFFGTGRWSYRTNIDNMYKWMELQSNNSTIKKENENLSELLGDTVITIVCKFTDCDFGMEILYNGEATWSLDKNLMLPLTDIIETNLGFNYKNLVDNNVIDSNDIFIDITNEELIKENILHEGDYEIGKIAEGLGIRKEVVIKKIKDELTIEAIKESQWIELNGTAVNINTIPDMVFDFAKTHMSYNPA